MAISSNQLNQIEGFFEHSNFMSKGAVITDLDGTAVHENNGVTIIHRDVEMGLKKIYEAGRPVVINTLRFPLSVIRTFAREWYLLSGASIPCVLLNGSQVGLIVKEEEGFVFKQLAAFPLKADEIDSILGTIQSFGDAMKDVILFYYPEDWEQGEIIWTPAKEKIPVIENKYRSASIVFSSSVEDLSTCLHEQPICMILMLIETSEDCLMAYQHTKKNNFFTSEGIDKLSGTMEIARLLNFEPEESVGAGDSAMDVFLSVTGLAVHVRNPALPFKGKRSTVQLENYHDFGDLLDRLSKKQKEQLISD